MHSASSSAGTDFLALPVAVLPVTKYIDQRFFEIRKFSTLFVLTNTHCIAFEWKNDKAYK